MDAADCASKLSDFIETYGFDGANIDFKDLAPFQSEAIPWLTKFTLSLSSDNRNNRTIFSHSIDITLFDKALLPTGDYSLI